METATVNDALSPRNMDDVDEYGIETPILEAHAAQIAALQAADGASAGSADAPNSAAAAALQRRARASKKIPPKQNTVPMDPVIEEQPSEASSYRSMEESETTKEQDEPPDE
eukprot:2515720-Amphidinium_carterae.1